jgi:membrane protease YdiL (CAAX protease family)
MSNRKERKKKKLLLIIVSCFVFGIGYYILNEVSTWYEVPLGITFHVILGCTLMASSGIYVIYTIKKVFFTKRSKRTKHIYLEDKLKDPKSE